SAQPEPPRPSRFLTPTEQTAGAPPPAKSANESNVAQRRDNGRETTAASPTKPPEPAAEPAEPSAPTRLPTQAQPESSSIISAGDPVPHPRPRPLALNKEQPAPAPEPAPNNAAPPNPAASQPATLAVAPVERPIAAPSAVPRDTAGTEKPEAQMPNRQAV